MSNRWKNWALIAATMLVVDWNLSFGPLTIQAVWRCTGDLKPSADEVRQCHHLKTIGSLTLSGGIVKP